MSFVSASDFPSGRHVAVVEAEERHAQLAEQLERRRGLLLRQLDGVRRRGARAAERAGAEDVEAVPHERVPVADGHAQVSFHALAADFLSLS
jgi:hypothetical protein